MKFTTGQMVKVIKSLTPWTGDIGTIVGIYENESPPSYDVQLHSVMLMNFSEPYLEALDTKTTEEKSE